MVKVNGRRRGTLTRRGQGQVGEGLLRRYGAEGNARVMLPRAPTQQRQLPLVGKAPKATTAKKATGHHHTSASSGGSSHSVTPAEVTSAVLAALAGGPLRLAIEAIARQVVWEMEREQQGAMQQGGSYQRLGGF